MGSIGEDGRGGAKAFSKWKGGGRRSERRQLRDSGVELPLRPATKDRPGSHTSRALVVQRSGAVRWLLVRWPLSQPSFGSLHCTCTVWAVQGGATEGVVSFLALHTSAAVQVSVISPNPNPNACHPVGCYTLVLYGTVPSSLSPPTPHRVTPYCVSRHT